MALVRLRAWAPAGGQDVAPGQPVCQVLVCQMPGSGALASEQPGSEQPDSEQPDSKQQGSGREPGWQLQPASAPGAGQAWAPVWAWGRQLRAPLPERS